MAGNIAIRAVGKDERAAWEPLWDGYIAFYQATLAPGDHLLMITDGFTEAHDLQDALYGDARVARFMAAVAPGDPAALARLAGEVRAFAAGRPAFDDMAALLLAYGVP